MALSPLLPEEERVVEIDNVPAPSKTYALGEGTIDGFIDGETALRQFISKAIRTARYRFLIYDDEYGCEIEDLIGSDVTAELLQSEIPQIITDALIYDDRIESVSGFNIERTGDQLYVSFTVTSIDGTLITEGVTLNGD
ncbi:DUF2634 domain-containing protein [Cytobacillus gottheilii]|uniref:DUF2634 domain-containing protein n=1 Tax=Cytobacillus gottheilii TaxID=859144 RepID=A0ABX8FG71_9BACI|nr:DUF2634 domain-containing protein [Cytobacillus gottheilii]QVY62994.1 DUF2634 domain-containing protein [Cytobacillus gottheilii]